MSAPVVLVVEDNTANRLCFEHLLQRAGFEVKCASDAPGALSAALSTAPDIVVLDLCLPSLDDGLGVLYRLKLDPQSHEIPIICITASADHSIEQRCREAGCASFAQKPITAEKLIELVQQGLSGSGLIR